MYVYKKTYICMYINMHTLYILYINCCVGTTVTTNTYYFYSPAYSNTK